MMHGCLSAHTMQPLKRNTFAQESGVKDRRRKGGQSCMHHPVKESKGNNGRWCTITTLSFIILGEREGWREGKKNFTPSTRTTNDDVERKAYSPAIYSSPPVFLPFGFKQILAILSLSVSLSLVSDRDHAKPQKPTKVLPEF